MSKARGQGDRKYYGGGVFSKMHGVWSKTPDGRRHPVMNKGKDGQLIQRKEERFYIRFKLPDGRWRALAAGTTVTQARRKREKIRGEILAGTHS